MYSLPRHKENDPKRIREFIDEYPFAFVTGCNVQNEPIATQIPVFVEEQDDKQLLRGHIMKNTDHHKAFQHNSNVLAVFTGRHTYVSGTWYTNPHTPSTWNYMSVHVKGQIRFLDETALEDILRKTTLHFENYNSASSTIYDNLPVEMKQRYLRMIVSFEIEIHKIDTVFKLSQDRDYQSYLNIIEKLQQQDLDGQVIAAEMQKRIGEVFPSRH